MTDNTSLIAAANAWLADDDDTKTRDELAALIDKVNAGDDKALKELTDRFSMTLEFGTAGLRGVLGAGPNRMNRVLVRRVSAGLADYLLANVPDARTRGVVIGRDARHNSLEFSEDTARILAGRGIMSRLAHRPGPTPTTAWSTTNHNAAAGVMVTASHNPPEYNGYKVYWGNGAQIIPPQDTGIADAFAKITSAKSQTMPSLADARKSGLVIDFTEKEHDDYLAAVFAERSARGVNAPAKPMSIAYTPMHGVGAASVEPAFARIPGYHLHSEPAQRDPNPDFPTVAFPNPEEKGAMDLVLALADKIDAQLVLANDPDADRLCVAVLDEESSSKYRVLTGDQVGALIADYLLATTPKDKPRLVATTIVSSQLLQHLATSYGADYRETLTGFKWIGNAAIAWEAQTGGRFLMGYEEALGYTMGSLVRDKDGISSALAFADLVEWNGAQGRSVIAHLYDIYRRVGLFFTKPGAEGLAEIKATMTKARSNAPTEIAGRRVTKIEDLLHGGEGLPSSDVLVYRLDGGDRVIMRPSGTEPKLKTYYEVRITIAAGESMDSARTRAHAALATLCEAHQASMH